MSTKRKLIVHEEPKSPISEAFRTLRTNLQYAKADEKLQTILVTSSGPGEGKSTVIANLAVALGQSNKKVILVDCDLRKPVQHRIFERKKEGVTNYLAQDIPLQSVLQDTDIPNLRLITSGPIPPNPSELLGSAKMQRLLDELKTMSDYILIDAPPTIAVTDASVLASKVDGIVLAIGVGVNKPQMVKRAKDLLINAKGKLLGAVLNRVEIEKEHSYYYYYYGEKDKKKIKE